MYLYGGLPKPVAFLILILFALYLGLYHALFAACIASVRRSSTGTSAALCLAPFVWVAVELARARITGFPWDLLGNSQVDDLLLTSIAPVAGVMGISFLIAAINVIFSSLFFVPRKKRFYIQATAGMLALAIIFITNAGMRETAQSTKTTDYAVMAQENLSVGAPGREERPLTPGEELSSFSRMSTNPGYSHNSLKGTPPTIIIWPEAPSHLQSNDPTFRAAMSQLAISTRAPLVIGSLGVDFDPASPRGYFLYDSASLFDAAGAYRGRYDKIHLVPWGEYIPFKRFFGFAHKLTEGVGDMDPGRARTVFTTAGHTYGVFVCYESIFGDEVRHFAQGDGQPGAEVLVQISDDGWYGDTGAPWQHLNMARMRAIENHRWLLRSTNTGITTAIDPQGRMAAQAPRHTRAAFAFPFAFEQGTTFYTRHGDWFAWLCTFITLLALLLPLLKSSRRNPSNSSYESSV